MTAALKSDCFLTSLESNFTDCCNDEVCYQINVEARTTQELAALRRQYIIFRFRLPVSSLCRRLSRYTRLLHNFTTVHTVHVHGTIIRTVQAAFCVWAPAQRFVSFQTYSTLSAFETCNALSANLK